MGCCNSTRVNWGWVYCNWRERLLSFQHGDRAWKEWTWYGQYIMERNGRNYFTIFSNAFAAHNSIPFILIEPCTTQEQNSPSQPFYFCIALHSIYWIPHYMYIHNTFDTCTTNNNIWICTNDRIVYISGYCISQGLRYKQLVENHCQNINNQLKLSFNFTVNIICNIYYCVCSNSWLIYLILWNNL